MARSTRAVLGDVLFLGAGPAARLIACAIAQNGHKVHVAGDPVIASAMLAGGPSHLWRDGWLQGDYPELTGSDTVEVRWYIPRTHHRPQVVLPQQGEADGRLYPGHRLKAFGEAYFGLQPSRGRTEFDAVPLGWRRLDALLRRREAALGDNINVEPMLPSHLAEVDSGVFATFRGRLTRRYDVVVNTLEPTLFGRLIEEPTTARAAAMLATFDGRPMTLIRSDEPPCDMRGVDGDLILYCGDEDIWWHRVSTVDGGWCYETAMSVAEARQADHVAMQVGAHVDRAMIMTRREDRPQYPAYVVPLGALAEWDQDLFISDIMGRVGAYVAKIEKTLASRLRVGRAR